MEIKFTYLQFTVYLCVVRFGRDLRHNTQVDGEIAVTIADTSGASVSYRVLLLLFSLLFVLLPSAFCAFSVDVVFAALLMSTLITVDVYNCAVTITIP